MSDKTYPDAITGWGMRRILTEWICEKRNIDEEDDAFSELACEVDECIELIEDRLDEKFDWPKGNNHE